MKILTTLCLSIFLMGSAFSQEIDQRLLQRYSQSELEGMIESNKAEYDVLAYALDNGIYFIDRPEGKTVDAPALSTEGKELNFIALGLEIKEQSQYFEVSNGKLLVLKSNWLLNYELKKQK